jgi:UDP-2-acetamido-3-amino-2,3-dideoxy-glucuronate N-acetyltransferase
MENDKPFFVHTSALCESTQVGEGTRIWAFAHVMKNAQVGCQCNIGDHAFLESGAILGDRVTVKNNVMIWEGVTVEEDVFLGPGAMFTNDRYPRSPRMAGVDAVAKRYSDKANWLSTTRVRRGASIGAGAIILCGTTIGEYALIGAGAMVRSDVPAHALMAGNPATQVGWVCHCAGKLSLSLIGTLLCPLCQRVYRIEDNQLRPV